MEEKNQTININPVTININTTPPTPTEPEIPHSPPASTGTLFGMVFSDPYSLGHQMTIRTTWWLPFIIAAFFATSYVLVGQKQMLRMVEQKITQSFQGQNMQLPADKQKEIIDMTTHWTKISAPVFALIGPLIYAAVGGLILLFVCNLLMGGTGRFVQLYSGLMWLQLISSLGTLIRIPLVIMRDSFEIPMGPAVLMPEGSQGFLYTILSGLDVFTVWQVIAGGLMIAGIYRWSKAKGTTAALIIYCIVILISAGFASLGSGVTVQSH